MNKEWEKTDKKCNECGSILYESLFSTRIFGQGDLYCKKCNITTECKETRIKRKNMLGVIDAYSSYGQY